MTQRERKLLTGLLGVLGVIGGLIFFVKLFWEPLEKSNQDLDDLQTKVGDKQRDLMKKRAEKREFGRLKMLSLPADPNPRHQSFELAWVEYDKYLRELMGKSGLKSVLITSIQPAQRALINPRDKKKPLYVPLTFTVSATGNLTSVVAMFERFYQTPLLHQIKSFSIKPAKQDAARTPQAAARMAPAGGEAVPQGGGGGIRGGQGGGPRGGRGGFGGDQAGGLAGGPRGGRGGLGGDQAGGFAGGRGRGGRGGNAAQNLDVKMTIEALLVDGADKRSFLMPADVRLFALNGLTALRGGPAGLALVPYAVDTTGLVKPRPLATLWTPGGYAPISRKNVFFSPVPPSTQRRQMEYPGLDINQFVRLVSIVKNDDNYEAYIYDVYNDQPTRLRAKDKRVLWARQNRPVRAFQTFRFFSSEGDRRTARVARITDTDIYFNYDGDYYQMHFGESVAEALEHKLSEAKAEALGLPLEPE